MIELTLVGYISVMYQVFKHSYMINKSHHINGCCINGCMNHIVYGSGGICLVRIVSYFPTEEQNLEDKGEDQYLFLEPTMSTEFT